VSYLKRILLIALLATGIAVSVTGCSDGPAEEAGEKIDRTVEKGADKLEEAGEEIEDKVDRRE
jgi:hypothetical protein